MSDIKIASIAKSPEQVLKASSSSKTRRLPDGGIERVDSAGNKVVEYGGRDGLEPTRYGDWEMKGRCIDF